MSLPIRLHFCLYAFLLLFLASNRSAQAFAPEREIDQPGETEYGKASWYGSDQGCQTASGERFDASDLTAAHRHLPFGTIVRVTNQENGRSVEVRINDRGPWRHGRIIDVSSAAANVLQMKKSGIVSVELEIIRLGSPRRSAALAQTSAP